MSKLVEQIDAMVQDHNACDEIILIYQAAKNAETMIEARIFAKAMSRVFCENTWIKSIDMVLRNYGDFNSESSEYIDRFALEAYKVELNHEALRSEPDADAIIDDPLVAADNAIGDDQSMDEALTVADYALNKIAQSPPVEAASLCIIRLDEATLDAIRTMNENDSNADPFEIFRLIAPEAADLIFSRYRNPTRERQADR